jgi:ribosomal protein L11 methyltransferase
VSWKLILTLDEASRDAAAGFLFDLGAQGVEERPDGLFGWFAAEADPELLRQGAENYLRSLESLPGHDSGAWSATVEHQVDEDWQAVWKSQWRQQHVGRHLSICPSWIEPEETETRHVLRLDPGNAFGTGTHESTRLLLEWLDDLNGQLAGLNVLDAGCGTGILSLAALKLGAAFVLGLDIEPEAVENSRENARVNDCRSNSFFRLGDPRELGAEYSFDLVLANIQRSVIEEIFPDLLRVLKPGGRLLLAGLLEPEEGVIRALAAEWRLDPPEVRHSGEWIAMGLVRSAACEV